MKKLTCLSYGEVVGSYGEFQVKDIIGTRGRRHSHHHEAILSRLKVDSLNSFT